MGTLGIHLGVKIEHFLGELIMRDLPMVGSRLNRETMPCRAPAGTEPSSREKETKGISCSKRSRAIISSIDLCWQKISALEW